MKSIPTSQKLSSNYNKYISKRILHKSWSILFLSLNTKHSTGKCYLQNPLWLLYNLIFKKISHLDKTDLCRDLFFYVCNMMFQKKSIFKFSHIKMNDYIYHRQVKFKEIISKIYWIFFFKNASKYKYQRILGYVINRISFSF